MKLLAWGVVVGVLLTIVSGLVLLSLSRPDDAAAIIAQQIARDNANATATAVARVAESQQAVVRTDWAPFTWAFGLCLVGIVLVAGGYALFHDLHVDVALRQRAIGLVYPRSGYLPVSMTSILVSSADAYQQNRVHSRANGQARLTQVTHNHDQRRLGPPTAGWGGSVASPSAVPALLPQGAPEEPAIRLQDLFDARAFFEESLLVAFHRATRKPIYMRWDQFIAPIFAGKPRNGKTSGLAFSVLSFALYLANLGLDCKILAFDPHYGAADSLSARLAGLAEWFVCQPGRTWQDLDKFCRWITGELERRKATGPDAWGGGLIFIVDEMSSIFVRLASDPEREAWERTAILFAQTMYTLNTQGPKFLMTMWGATHEVSATGMSARGNDNLIKDAVSTWVVFNLEQKTVQSHLRWGSDLAKRISEQRPGQAVLMNHLSGLPATEILYPQVPGEALRQGVLLARETIRDRQKRGAVSVPATMPWKQETNTLDQVEWPNVIDTMLNDDEWAAALDEIATAAPPVVPEAVVVREVVEVTPPPLEDETGRLPVVGEGDAVSEGAASRASAPSGTPAAWQTWVEMAKQLEAKRMNGRELPIEYQEYLAFILTKMLGKSATATLEVLWGVKGGDLWPVYSQRLRDWAATWANTGPPAQPVFASPEGDEGQSRRDEGGSL